MKDLISASISDGSKKVYRKAWQRFSDFHRQFVASHNPDAALCPYSCYALFIAHQDFLGLSPATITTYISALSHIGRRNTSQALGKNWVIRQLLIGLKKRRPSADVRLPVTEPILFRLVDRVFGRSLSEYDKILFASMFLVAFYGFFRIGEITSCNNQNNKPFAVVA